MLNLHAFVGDLHALQTHLYARRAMVSQAEKREALLGEASALALLNALADTGGEAAPSDLDEPTGLAPSTRSKWLKRLRDHGLVTGPKARVQLTPEGWAVASRLPALPGVQLELRDAINRWPTEAHRAFVRLSLAAVVARHQLGEAAPHGHPGFVAAGRTGTGKTALARFVCDVFGLDQAAAIVGLPDRTGGEILGRREKDEGGWRFEPSPLLALPFVVFDEFDKADPGLQRDALLCFQGDYAIVKDGTRLEVRAVPMLTCNKKAHGRIPVPEEYRRRTIVLDTDPLLALLTELDVELRELDLAGGPPRLNLDELRPPALHLPDETYTVLRGLLRDFLTPEGAVLVNVQALELLALGYAPLMGEAPLEASALAVVHDYLECAETVGETQPSWRGPMLAAAQEILGTGNGATGDIAAALERASSEQLAIEAAREDRRAARIREQDSLTSRRAELVTMLRLAEQDLDARKLPREHKVAGAGARATLRKLRDEAGQLRSAEALNELKQRADQAFRHTTAILAAIASERAAAESERQAAQHGRRQAAAQAREAKAAARRELKELRDRAGDLERLYLRRRTEPDEQPHRLLRRLGLLEYNRIEVEPRGGIGGFFDRLAGEHGWWKSSVDPSLQFIGTADGAEELAEWGPGTKAVLAAALRPLHARERGLERQLGIPPRKMRDRIV